MAARVHLALVLLFASWCASCGGAGEICDNRIDDDGDGFVDCGDQDCFAVCGEDCDNALDDDGDGLVDCLDDDCDATCPGQFGDEDCDNGLDDDGDWAVDCLDDDCQPVCDGDNDGFVTAGRGGLDCDDTEARVNPDADEVPYNGLDDDCNPDTSDTDVDGDGVDASEVGGADCDDDHAATYPGAPETCGDGVVNDCDDPGATFVREDCFVDRSVVTADAVLIGTTTDDWTGSSLASAGDVNGDGYDDLAIGAYGEGAKHGAVYLVHGPLSGRVDLAQAVVKWTGESEDDWAGFSLAGGSDLTGDGRPDVVIGAQYDDATSNNAGAVYIVNPNTLGLVDLADAHTKIVGAHAFDQAGFSVALPGDVTGDGVPDLAIGSLLGAFDESQPGSVHVVPGPISAGEVHLETMDGRIRGQSRNDRTGCDVSGAGDLDGDGVNDLVVGACLVDRNQDAERREDRGGAFQFSSFTTAPRTLRDDADGSLFGERSGDQLGAAVASAGDVNGDGLGDLIVGAPYFDVPGADEQPVLDVGRAYLVLGPATGVMAPVATFDGLAEGDELGTSVAGLGDLDGDGFDDFAIGAPKHDAGGQDAGAVYVMFGPVGGDSTLADAAFVLTGSSAFDFAGQAVASAGDVDGDGELDLLVGAPFHDGAAPSSGAAYLFTFGH